MLLDVVTGPVLGTNCYVLAAEDARECVLVDPGIGLDEPVESILAERGLRPTAALITHGHLDHTLALATLCRRYELPVYLHEADVYRLADPVGTLGPELAPVLGELAKGWVEPPVVRAFSDATELHLAGVRIRPIHAPGHTEGSTLYHVPDVLDAPGHRDEGPGVCFTGDVLFAGTIGRTDLPGGDDALMRRTLTDLAKPAAMGGLLDATTVLPGHGERSTMGTERATNPYLRQLGPDTGGLREDQ